MKRVIRGVVAAMAAYALALAMVGCAGGGSGQSSSTRTVTAADGTQVEIPAQVTKVAPNIGALAEVTMIVSKGDPVISAAATQQIGDKFKQYFPRYSEGNPNGYSAQSVEDLIASGTQVVFGIQSMYSDDQLDQLKQAGIAFVPINSVSTVDELCDAIELIGEILGGDYQQQAQKFSTYWKQQLSDAKNATATVGDKQTILEAMYNSGSFTTVNSSDIMNEYFEAAGLTNVAGNLQKSSAGSNGQGSGGNGQGSGNKSGGGAQGIAIDAESIAQMNPEWIITNSQEGKEALMSNPALSKVTAIANDHVLVSPQGAYLWIVRSGEGAMVPMWLVSQVYPDLAGGYDAKTAVKDFFKEYYSYDLDDAAVEGILAGQSSAVTR